MKQLLTIIFLFCFFISAKGQFYNGHQQMQFGQNRVQYVNLEWLYHRYDRYDMYFYQDGRNLSYYASDRIAEFLPKLEKSFGHTLSKRIIFLVYNRLTDFRQSNIGLITFDNSSNTGGTVQIIDNKVFLYFENDHKAFDEQIKMAISRLIVNDMLYSSVKNKIASTAKIKLPDWYIDGLAAYQSMSWTAKIEDKIKDGFVSKRFNKFNSLTGDDALYAGYSMWYFIDKNYGKDAIPSLIYFTSISKNSNLAFKHVLGSSLKDIAVSWKQFYTDKFGIEKQKIAIKDSTAVVAKPKKNTQYSNIKVSPDQKYSAFTSNIMGKYKVFIKDNQTGKIEKILCREHKIKQITDYSYPILAWHPTSKVLLFLTEEKAHVYMYQYNVNSGQISKRMLPKFDKVFSYSYSDDGLNLAMSVQMGGNIDIVVFNIASGAFERITNDLADDIHPRFIENSTKIIFASNRKSNIIKEEKVAQKENYDNLTDNYDIFVYDYQNRDIELNRITDTKHQNEIYPSSTGHNQFTYISDKSGVNNIYASKLDSSIAFIDTTIHYNYHNKTLAKSNFKHNISFFDFDSKNLLDAFAFTRKERGYLYQKDDLQTINQEPKASYFKQKQINQERKADSLLEVNRLKEIKEKQRIDSILRNPPKNLPLPDTSRIDIFNYTFEKEKDIVYRYLMYGSDLKDSVVYGQRPRQRNYYTTFYIDNLTAQVDMSQLNESYQPFTGGPYYFNPGVNMMFKIGVMDLFENYRLSAMMRIGGNLDSYEYYLTFENLRSRLDKEYVYHRYTYRNYYDYYATKVITNEAKVIFSYPLSQVSCIKATVGLRFDQNKVLVSDSPYLNQDNQYQVFGQAKLEHIYDNTISLGTNLYSGFRSKVWTELYQQVEGKYDIISSWGFDLRYYQKIHRNFIFASRLAGATNFGTGKIIYYLGGVDNWTSFKPVEETFDQSIEIDQEENYIYQAVATNMRGFYQNCRNGNTFVVLNNELRLPIFRYLFNRPINSKMINDFQVVGFFDCGSAWSGFNPRNADNAYNQFVCQNGSLTMTIEVERPSLVCGYGWGLRTSLFGYFMRLDWSWGIEAHQILPRVFYFSLGMDF